MLIELQWIIFLRKKWFVPYRCAVLYNYSFIFPSTRFNFLKNFQVWACYCSRWICVHLNNSERTLNRGGNEFRPWPTRKSIFFWNNAWVPINKLILPLRKFLMILFFCLVSVFPDKNSISIWQFLKMKSWSFLFYN